MSREVKNQALARIANGRTVRFVGSAKWNIGNQIVHVRFRTSPKSKEIFSYNINPNTLGADFELWICGGVESYYLFPIAIMKDIYSDPDAYVDRRHPEIRVAEVDTVTHQLLYGCGGKTQNVSKYFRATLDRF